MSLVPEVYICGGKIVAEVMNTLEESFRRRMHFHSIYLLAEKETNWFMQENVRVSLFCKMVDDVDMVVIILQGADSTDERDRKIYAAGYANGRGIPVVVWIERGCPVPLQMITISTIAILVYDSIIDSGDCIYSTECVYYEGENSLSKATLTLATEHLKKKQRRSREE